MFESMIEELLKSTGRKVLIEQEDGKTYIIEQPAILTSNYQSVAQPIKIEEPALFEDLKLSVFVQSKWNIKPKKGGYVSLVHLEPDGSIKAEEDYIIGTIVDVIVMQEKIGYIVYCNSQEVKKYAND